MQIYVDADGFPTAPKELLIRAAIRLQVPLVFVANKRVRYEPAAMISTMIVPEDRILPMIALLNWQGRATW
jgi:uncharacterized protein YaiI (UPF0178 family)